jgi:hypothetical protein
MTFCTKCGQHLEEGDAFCSICGEPQVPSSSAAQGNSDIAKQKLSIAEDLFTQGKYELALAAYDQGVIYDPINAQLYAGRGASLWALGRYNEAITAFDRAIEIDPHYLSARNLKTSLLISMGKLQEALHEAQRSVDIDSNDPEAHAIRGRVLSFMNRDEEAMAEIDCAIELCGDGFGFLVDKAAILSSCGKLYEATDQMNEFLRQTDCATVHQTTDLMLANPTLRPREREFFESYLQDTKRIEEQVAPLVIDRIRVEFCAFLLDLVAGPLATLGISPHLSDKAKQNLVRALPKDEQSKVTVQGMSELCEKFLWPSSEQLFVGEQRTLWAARNAWYCRFGWLEDTLLNLDKYCKDLRDRVYLTEVNTANLREKLIAAGLDANYNPEQSLFNQVRILVLEAISRDMPQSEFRIKLARLIDEAEAAEWLEIAPARNRVAHLIELYTPFEGDSTAQIISKADLASLAIGIERSILDVAYATGYGLAETHRLALESAPKYGWLRTTIDGLRESQGSQPDVRIAIFVGLASNASRQELERDLTAAQTRA